MQSNKALDEARELVKCGKFKKAEDLYKKFLVLPMDKIKAHILKI